MITVLSATNRNEAKTLAVSKRVMQDLEKNNIEAQLCDLNKLPRGLFEAEHYWNTPPEFDVFQGMITNTDAILIVTPEYNGSFPGVMKYFIDLLKFPESFQNKRVAFIGVSAGIFGAMRSIEQLTQILQYREAHIYNKKVLLMGIEKIFDAEKFAFIDKAFEERYTKFLDEFVSYLK